MGKVVTNPWNASLFSFTRLLVHGESLPTQSKLHRNNGMKTPHILTEVRSGSREITCMQCLLFLTFLNFYAVCVCFLTFC